MNMKKKKSPMVSLTKSFNQTEGEAYSLNICKLGRFDSDSVSEELHLL